MKPLTRFIRRRKVHFWGSNYVITPRLVNWIHGDGLKVMRFQPLNTRPDYYVLRIDSKMETDSDEFHDLLDTIKEEIEDQFGRARDEYRHDNGRTYVKHWPWPALNDDSGCAWDEIATLKRPDTRQERRVRIDLKRAA